MTVYEHKVVDFDRYHGQFVSANADHAAKPPGLFRDKRSPEEREAWDRSIEAKIEAESASPERVLETLLNEHSVEGWELHSFVPRFGYRWKPDTWVNNLGERISTLGDGWPAAVILRRPQRDAS